MKGGSGGTRRSHRDYTQRIQTPKAQNVIKSDNDCQYRLKINLINIQPAITKCKIGDVLDVNIDPIDKVAAYDSTGNVCGYIGTAILTKILQCIRSGVEYKATIESLSHTDCKVLFENK